MIAHKRCIAAVDLGGTKIYSAVLDGDTTAGDDLRPTEADRGLDAVLDRIVDSVKSSTSKAGLTLSDLTGVGIVAPGPVDSTTGHITNAPNLPGWQDVPLREMLSRLLELPVVVENDAKAAALGEYAAGAGQGAHVMVYLTVSTGIGSGFVFDGELFRGATGSAGEVGHVMLQRNGPVCGCGRRGCLEALASGTAIAREAREALAAGRAEGLRCLVAESGGEVTSALVARAAAEGDAGAAQIIREAGEWLGIGLGNLVNTINPDVIVIGGGAAHIGPPLLDPAEAMMRTIILAAPAARVQIRTAVMEYAAIRGVAELVQRQQ